MILSAFLLGLAKSGFKGLGVIIVTLMAMAIPAKESTGVVLPLLVAADIMAVYYYRKDVQMKILLSILPFMILGVLTGVLVGDHISAGVFKKLMAGIILISVIIMIYISRKTTANDIEPKPKLAAVIGYAAGFTTMIGNLAGPFVNLYFIAINTSKNQFIATVAWIFFIINVFKVPFHIWVWDTINAESLYLDLKLLPVVIIGFIVGYKLISYVSDALFRKYIIAMTILGAVLIFIN
jgi:uncharacterized membrane protein YfcA